MKIINVGDRVMNTWIYEIPEGYVMVDTGYPGQLKNVERRMAAHGLDWSAIRYVFVTHAHDDHVGFLNELMGKAPGFRVILNPAGLPVLRRGQNSFEGGCSAYGAWLFCRCMALWGKGRHLFPPLEERFDDRLLFITEETREELETLLQGRVLFTPGHTKDFVFLKVGDRIFCGDAAMNGFPSKNRVTIWVENTADFGSSWDTLLAEDAQTLIPAHGRQFPKEDLVRFRSYVDRIRLYALPES